MNTSVALLTAIGMFLSLLTHAQDMPLKKGKVTVIQDSLVARLIQRNLALNESKQSMPGYRIQIYFGTDRTRANEIRTGFIREQGIEKEVYLLYHQPNFKVRVGDFKTRLEALSALQLISISYPGAFLVKDDVRLPK